ncbi:serine hydrolase [Maricaulis sp.]|uniref:serine hydrolase domain-containing protein n=1 Tax=Maricaulis sp. TaxID=1486257 RepID=UPI001B1737A8|nr:serine hydrolase domain-containing protein [Maricaulis sp.]MBO6765961.1 beta-lactamase family protein [Maricaulis sp.]
MRRFLTAAASITALATAAQAQPDGWTDAEIAALDASIQQMMAEEEVVGLAYALIDQGEVEHVAAFGYRNLENGWPLETDTVMYGASLTKAAFAYYVLMLVDEGLLDLDTSIADYLPRPLPDYVTGDDDWSDLADQPQWRELTPRIILSNGTGFANFRWLEDDGRLQFHFAPGERQTYSAEGFYILQHVIEEGLGLDLKAEMQRRIFDRFGMVNTSMQWRPDFRENLADGYAMDGTFEPHDERSGVSAAGSMDTTIADQARMWAGFIAGDGLSEAARAQFVAPSQTIRSPSQFPTLTTQEDPRAAEIGLAGGLGVIVYRDENGLWFDKGGHNPWTGNRAICHEETRRCIVFLGNSVRAELIYPAITEMAMGENPVPWWWIYPGQFAE